MLGHLGCLTRERSFHTLHVTEIPRPVALVTTIRPNINLRLLHTASTHIIILLHYIFIGLHILLVLHACLLINGARSVLVHQKGTLARILSGGFLAVLLLGLQAHFHDGALVVLNGFVQMMLHDSVGHPEVNGHVT